MRPYFPVVVAGLLISHEAEAAIKSSEPPFVTREQHTPESDPPSRAHTYGLFGTSAATTSSPARPGLYGLSITAVTE
jgi:hypothetical protein